MHPQVDERVCLEPSQQVQIKGSVARVRREVPVEEQAHRVSLYPQGGLDAKPQIPQLDARSDGGAVAGRREASRLRLLSQVAPVGFHPPDEDVVGG